MSAPIKGSRGRVVWFAVLTLVFVGMTIYLVRDAVLTATVGNRLLDAVLAVLVVSGVPTTLRKLRAEVAAFRGRL